MSPAELQSAILSVLQEVQTLSGRPWAGLSETAKPLLDLDGFDSLCGLEATVMVEERLGCGDLGVDSVFVSDDGQRSLSIREIAERLANRLPTDRGGK